MPSVVPPGPAVRKSLKGRGVSFILGTKGGSPYAGRNQNRSVLVVWTAAVTEQITQLVSRLQEGPAQILTGSRDGQLEILPPDKIVRIYAAGGRVYAATAQGEYLLRLRLYELDPRRFIRISHSEIVNLDQIQCFDLNLAGTICIRLADGNTAYVSRRYVSKIKQILGV